MRKDSADLSRAMSHALRHEPWLYELELDDGAWVPVAALLEALRRQRPEWAGLEVSDLEQVVRTSSKKRHELRAGSIRALYGHSVPGKLHKLRAIPPRALYHGTDPEMCARIMVEGLKPMGRQYVHLSVDQAMAVEVGRRKAAHPIVLAVDAATAHEAGSVFYEGNEQVWLAEGIAPEFLRPMP